MRLRNGEFLGEMMKPYIIKWGILGTSPISKTMARAIKDSSYGKLIAIGSRSRDRAEHFKKEFGLEKHYGDYESVLSDHDIDVVYIGLPNHLHHQWIINAACAKKHILCEKPFTVNEQEALCAIEAIEKAQVFCMEALMYRCHPLIKKLHELVNSDVLGELRLINASYTADISSIANKTAGGSILNIGCYPLSLVRMVANDEPISIKTSARIENLREIRQASAILTFTKPLIATISVADDLKMSWHFAIYGTKGSITALSNPWYPKGHSRIFISQNGTEDAVVTIAEQKSVYAYQIDAVNEAIKNSKLIGEITLRESLLNMRSLERWQKECLSA